MATVRPHPTDHEGPHPESGRSKGGSSRSRLLTFRQGVALVILAALVGATAALSVAWMTGWGRETLIQRTTVIDRSNGTRATDVQGVLHRVLPSVVSISASSTQSSPFFGVGGAARVVTAVGTGVIVTASGEVATNDHVVSGATSITVTLNDSASKYTATILGASPQHDLALLRIEGVKNLVPADFANSDSTLVGDNVLAIGYALALSGGPTVTEGIISATGRQVATKTAGGANTVLTDMLQTDAAISSGNSGGPLVTASGQVVGINTAVAASSGSTTAQNIGFALPSNTVRALLSQLRAGASS